MHELRRIKDDVKFLKRSDAYFVQFPKRGRRVEQSHPNSPLRSKPILANNRRTERIKLCNRRAKPIKHRLRLASYFKDVGKRDMQRPFTHDKFESIGQGSYQLH